MLTMTQEEKELLFKDLCSRLPYGVKVNTIYSNEHASFYRRRACKNGVNELNLNIMWLYHVQFEIDIKPYLFPLESMSEEQKEELIEVIHPKDTAILAEILRKKAKGESVNGYGITHHAADWCNKNHFDYRRLIEKGLAIDATGLNIY